MATDPSLRRDKCTNDFLFVSFVAYLHYQTCVIPNGIPRGPAPFLPGFTPGPIKISGLMAFRSSIDLGVQYSGSQRFFIITNWNFEYRFKNLCLSVKRNPVLRDDIFVAPHGMKWNAG